MPRRRARWRMASALPTSTSGPGKRSAASSAQRSGPMPAGSPAVRAILASAFFVTVLDERAIARLPQPVLVRLVRLACADGLARRGLLAILRELVGAALEH